MMKHDSLGKEASKVANTQRYKERYLINATIRKHRLPEARKEKRCGTNKLGPVVQN